MRASPAQVLEYLLAIIAVVVAVSVVAVAFYRGSIRKQRRLNAEVKRLNKIISDIESDLVLAPPRDEYVIAALNRIYNKQLEDE